MPFSLSFLRLPHSNEARSDPHPQRLGPGLGDHPQRSPTADQGGGHIAPCGRCHQVVVGTVLEPGLKVQVLPMTDQWAPQSRGFAARVSWVVSGSPQCQSLLSLLEWDLMTSAGNSQAALLSNYKLHLSWLKPHISIYCCGLLTGRMRAESAQRGHNRTRSPECWGHF